MQPDADFECIAVMMEHSQDVKCIAWSPREEVSSPVTGDSAAIEKPGLTRAKLMMPSDPRFSLV